MGKPFQHHATILIMALCLAPAFIRAAPLPVEIERYGTLPTAQGDMAQYVVTVGTPVFTRERAGLAFLLSDKYGANGVLWIRLPDGTWRQVWYRNPTTEADFVVLERDGPSSLVVREDAKEEALPEPIRSLPATLQANVQMFYEFYSGAFRIYLVDPSEAAARRLMEALRQSD